MNRILMLAAVAGALTAAAPAAAQTAYSPVVFTTVDAFEATSASSFKVTGIVEGDSAATEHLFQTTYSATNPDLATRPAEACQRMALVAMTKPGMYRLSVLTTLYYAPIVCKLSRVNP